MNQFEQIKSDFFSFLMHHLNISMDLITTSQFDLNIDEEKQTFGDINSNIALICAKPLQQNPRTLALNIVENFKHPFIAKIEMAGPGFLNFFMTQTWYQTLALELAHKKASFFCQKPTHPKKINIEFVSANPTGPMHVGHGRNGILGDVLANILQFLHHDVCKEFYINDAGAQITKLGDSLKVRCLQLLGDDIQLPEDAYHGQNLVDLAGQCVAQFGKNLEQEPDTFFQVYAKEHMLADLQSTLENYGILFDIWFSEKSLHDHGKVDAALNRLITSGHTYVQDGALWFRSTTFGDDKDRVLKKANGELTYVAADVAYLIDKLDRGFDELIMILGHDHHSYKVRLHSIMQALGYDPKKLHIILYQLVHIMKDGAPVKMSKRSGNMITLSEVVDEVGKNVARFFFLNRKADAELQFDLDLALQQSNENPVYYIQYAYVRTLSIQRKAEEENITVNATCLYDQEFSDLEKLLLRKMCALKSLIYSISNNHQIHVLAYYTHELAGLFHKYYNMQRVIDASNPAVTQQRLHCIGLIQQTLQTCLFLMGITPLEKM
ncbi:MAG TPA: arginine--tRNA ligase [Candidatus Saccharimonadales bacterium]|nr:arginine--tRNA ligase [Candidatus Saccharimonadales bacterium]